MTRSRTLPSFICSQVSPPEALSPSRLRALRAQRRDKRLAPQALIFIPAAAGQPDRRPTIAAPAPSASPPLAAKPRVGARPEEA
jgi:hypothetical protein